MARRQTTSRRGGVPLPILMLALLVLGTLYLFTLIGLLTKLISDLCYVMVDPRVKFD